MTTSEAIGIAGRSAALDDGTTIDTDRGRPRDHQLRPPDDEAVLVRVERVRAARDRSTSAPMALTSASAAAIRARCSLASSPGRAAIAAASPAVSATRYRSVIAPSTSCAGSSVSSCPNRRCRSQYRTDLDGVVGISAVWNDDRDAHVELRGEHREVREHRRRQPALGAVVENVVVTDRDEARQASRPSPIAAAPTVGARRSPAVMIASTLGASRYRLVAM